MIAGQERIGFEASCLCSGFFLGRLCDKRVEGSIAEFALRDDTNYRAA
jgi:hypothetical protein